MLSHYLHIYRRFPTFDNPERLQDIKATLADFHRSSPILGINDAFLCIVVRHDGDPIREDTALAALHQCGYGEFCSAQTAAADKFPPCGLDHEFISDLEKTLATVAAHFPYVDAIYNHTLKSDGTRRFSKREACAAFLHLPLTHQLVDWYWAMHEYRLGQLTALEYRVKVGSTSTPYDT